MEEEPTNLPAQIAEAIVSIPKGLTPSVIKALDRLVAASVDIPVAWLQQKKVQIESQTASYKMVEDSIAQTVALDAGGDPEIAQRAMDTLVRKEYRKQSNREAVAMAMVEDMREDDAANISESGAANVVKEIDEDWLNVFERYAEDASSERLQGLWGRVLAGEVRRPGKYSTRTLRFLSEFSQADALTFEIFAKFSFSDHAPKKLVKPKYGSNIRDLIYLESSGLLQGSGGLGFQKSYTFNKEGYLTIVEKNLVIVLYGKPKKKIAYEVIALTPLGQELLDLVKSRNARDAAKAVAHAIRTPEVHSAYLGVIPEGSADVRIERMEVLWQKETSKTQTVDGSVE